MKEWARRATRTFLQTALGYLIVAVPTVDFMADKAAIRCTFVGIGVSAVAAGIAAVMNLGEGADK